MSAAQLYAERWTCVGPYSIEAMGAEIDGGFAALRAHTSTGIWRWRLRPQWSWRAVHGFPITPATH